MIETFDVFGHAKRLHDAEHLKDQCKKQKTTLVHSCKKIFANFSSVDSNYPKFYVYRL